VVNEDLKERVQQKNSVREDTTGVQQHWLKNTTARKNKGLLSKLGGGFINRIHKLIGHR